MRFPALTPHSASQLSSNFIPNSTPSTASFSFEPTSVLDLRRSPSPVHDHFPTTSLADVLSQTEDLTLLQSLNHHQQATVHNIDDWDSIMRELGLHDDFAPSALKPAFPTHHSPSSDSGITQFHDLGSSIIPGSDQPLFSPSDLEFTVWNANANVGFDFVEELIKAAGCFDSGDLQLAHAILSHLNQRLLSPIGKPIQRAAFYFKDALNSLLSVSTDPIRSSTLEIVESIKAQKAFSSISPIPMFSDFTANQAVLESIDSSTFIHIVDFEIGLGGQYASLLREIADRSASSKQSRVSISIRITAIVQDEFEKESTLVSDNLHHFAHDLQIRFRIDFVSLRSFEMLSEKSIDFTDDERTIVHLTPSTFRRTGVKFVTDLRLIIPNAVVLVTSEGWQTTETSSFRRSFVEGLEFYSVLLESLDAAVGGSDWVKKIEAFVLRRRIVAEVESMGCKTTSWRDMLAGAGMRPAGLSRLAEFQAECLVRKGDVRGFQVGTRHGELVLSWHGRPLVATSTWRF